MAFVPVVLLAFLGGLLPLAALLIARHRCRRHVLAKKAVTKWSLKYLAVYYMCTIGDYLIVYAITYTTGEEPWVLQFAGCLLLLLGPGLRDRPLRIRDHLRS